MTSQKTDRLSENEIVSCADWPERPTYVYPVDAGLNQSWQWL
jgi:hypothetical protein